MENKIILIRFLFMMILISTCLSGCSSFSNNDAGISQPNTQDLSEPIVITFAADAYEKTYYEGLAGIFHKENPGITVQIISIDNIFEYWEKENLRSLASLADTTIFEGDRAKLLDHPEYFLDLTSLIDVTPDIDIDDFWGDAIYAVEDNAGRILGLPISLGLMGIYYDTQIMNEEGLSIPDSGWTMDDLKAILSNEETLLEDSTPTTSIIAPQIDHSLAQNGGEVNHSELVDIVRDYVYLYQSGDIQFAGTTDAENSLPSLWVGALTSDAPSGEDELSITKYSFVPYPAISGDEDISTNIIFPTYGLISAGSEYPQEAWLWLNYLSYQAPGNVLEDTIPYAIPARISVAEEIFPWELIPLESQQAIRNALDNGWYGSNFPQAFQAVIASLTQVLAGERPLENAFKDLEIAAAPTPDPNPIVLNAPEEIPEVPLDSDVTVVHFYMPGSLTNDNNIYETLVEEFENTHSDIRIDFQSEFEWPGGNAFPYLTDLFDCFYWRENTSPGSVQDYVADLSPFIEGESVDYLQDFYPNMVEAFTSEGLIYGLPVTSNLELIKYNAALLDELGIDPPDTNWTFDDLLRLLEEIAEKTQEQEIYASSGLENYLLYGFGAQFYDLDVEPADIRINSTETQQAFHLVVDMINNRELYYPETYDNAINNQLRDNGQIALWLSSTSSRITSPFDEGVLPLPSIDGNFYGMGWSNPQALYISAKSNVKQACWDWIRFLSDQSNIFDAVPVRKSILTSPSYATAVGDDLVAVFETSMANATFRGGINMVTHPIDIWVTDSLHKLVAGGNPEMVLTEAQWKAENFVDCLGTHNLTHEDVYLISTENEDLRVQIGACALEVDPDFTTTFGYE